MEEEQPVFKVVDRRPFNPDGTPRELSPEEKEEAERAAKAAVVDEAAARAVASKPATPREPAPRPETPARETTRPPRTEPQPPHAGGDPLDDPTSFLSLIMSLAS